VTKRSRSKGNRGEREAAALLGAIKISRTGYPGPDLEWFGYPVEVKRYASPISKKIHTILRDTPILMERADHDEWIIHIRATDLLDLMEKAQ